jgi:lysyl-tRNA synthetase class II
MFPLRCKLLQDTNSTADRNQEATSRGKISTSTSLATRIRTVRIRARDSMAAAARARGTIQVVNAQECCNSMAVRNDTDSPASGNLIVVRGEEIRQQRPRFS